MIILIDHKLIYVVGFRDMMEEVLQSLLPSYDSLWRHCKPFLKPVSCTGRIPL